MQSMNYKEAADFLKITEGTLRNWVSKNRITPHKIGKHVLFFREELEKWVLTPGSKGVDHQPTPEKPVEKPSPKAALTPPEPAASTDWNGKFLVSVSDKSSKEPFVTLENLPGKNAQMTSKQLLKLARELVEAVEICENPAFRGTKNHRLFGEPSFSQSTVCVIPHDFVRDLKTLSQAATRTQDPQATTPEKYILKFICEGLTAQLPIINKRLKDRGNRAVTFLCVR